MRQQVEGWSAQQLTTEAAKLTIHRASSERDLMSPDTLRGGYTNSISIHSVWRSNDRTANVVESLKRVHLRIQETRFYSPIQGYCQVGRIPGIQVPIVVLASGIGRRFDQTWSYAKSLKALSEMR
jgi:hypothetical protein